jgi:hypothetical protein
MKYVHVDVLLSHSLSTALPSARLNFVFVCVQCDGSSFPLPCRAPTKLAFFSRSRLPYTQPRPTNPRLCVRLSSHDLLNRDGWEINERRRDESLCVIATASRQAMVNTTFWRLACTSLISCINFIRNQLRPCFRKCMAYIIFQLACISPRFRCSWPLT